MSVPSCPKNQALPGRFHARDNLLGEPLDGDLLGSRSRLATFRNEVNGLGDFRDVKQLGRDLHHLRCEQRHALSVSPGKLNEVFQFDVTQFIVCVFSNRVLGVMNQPAIQLAISLKAPRNFVRCLLLDLFHDGFGESLAETASQAFGLKWRHGDGVNVTTIERLIADLVRSATGKQEQQAGDNRSNHAWREHLIRSFTAGEDEAPFEPLYLVLVKATEERQSRQRQSGKGKWLFAARAEPRPPAGHKNLTTQKGRFSRQERFFTSTVVFRECGFQPFKFLLWFEW